ncbi:interferon tau-1-like [Astyanax mexicanus]|uniref:Interferon tau-1-like n=1 Tax=Astyanax mexicanus TaxID=7994 RepID=A0A8T2M643_ASTMX|nr:interferon tau-1-like [Astyanax mexicanus]
MPIKCQLQLRLVETTHNLLENMAGPIPFQCLDEKFGIKLPTWALQSNDSKQDVGVTKAVFKTFMNMGSLMENDGIPQYWDSGKLENFENIVYRQISENICNLGVSAQEDEDGFAQRDAALTHYFQKLAALLKEKEFSDCAWERVRHELLRVLQPVVFRREPLNPQKKRNKKRQTDEPHHSHWFIGATRSFNNSTLNSPLLVALEMVALKVLSILVLVMVHVLDAALIPCVWTQFRLKILNEESIDLLNSMVRNLHMAEFHIL